MVRYILKQIKIASSRAYGKWFAKNVVEETIDLDGLSEHMSNHNSPYSKGVIKGLLTDMIGCIKELLLEGKNVKIDDLAIFSLGIKNKVAAASEETFTIAKNVEGVKLRARATGELMSKSLNLEATLKKASYVNGKVTTEDNPSGGSNTDTNPSNGEASPNTSEGGESGNTQTVTAPVISGDTPFTDTSTVQITAEMGADIRYTTDGSTPTESSTQYSGSITLSDTATVKAIAIKDGVSSEVSSKTFVKNSGGGGGFEG